MLKLMKTNQEKEDPIYQHFDSTQLHSAFESTFKMKFYYVISLKNEPRSISKITFVNLN